MPHPAETGPDGHGTGRDPGAGRDRAAVTAGPAPSDRFRLPASQATPAGRQIAARIRAHGPISFAEFMAAALYDPAHGYYRSGRPTVGRDGDFLTSPELHPLFGYVIAALAAADWDARGRPAEYTLCDIGPGTGALVDAAFGWVAAQRPDFAAALRGVLVEPDGASRARQRERLGGFGARLTWCAGIEELAPLRGLVVANELLDAQPVHRLRWSGSGWEELFVGLTNDRFHDVPGPPCDSTLLAPLAGLTPRPGQVVEVCPGIAALVGAIAAAVDEGLLLFFDYGHPREQLYAPWRTQGTLMSFHRHTPGDDPYVRVGEQDLTCHVDLDAVAAAARRAGLVAYPPRSQAEWLAAMGATTPSPVAEAGRGADLDAHLERRRAAQLLSDPGGLGRIQLLAFAKGPTLDVAGLGAPGHVAGRSP